MRVLTWLPLFLLFLLAACRGEKTPTDDKSVAVQDKPTSLTTGCRQCHFNLDHDPNHAFECVECHQGNSDTSDKDMAHADLIAYPAHPDRMDRFCGRCHEKQVDDCKESLHFTLKREINLIRQKFGSESDLADLTEIPVSGIPASSLQLADDMLRRRCLRCHLYTSGDDYPLTSRGQGCAACHMHFISGSPVQHILVKTPRDEQCLSCHYGNVVGADYYGRFEHDYNREYRTPYVATKPFSRPYGVETHDLVPDIHQLRGLACVDCHSGKDLMAENEVEHLTCSTCHAWSSKDPLPALDNLSIRENKLFLRGRVSGLEHPVPPLQNPAHSEYPLVACQVCHAQWSFNDGTTYLLRNDSSDYEPWERLTVQSDSELENLLESSLAPGAIEKPPLMKDSITGEKRIGIWYKGYSKRRWDSMEIRRDRDGIIKVFRPILDIYLSWIDADEDVIFDNTTGDGPDWLPYVPHTTGRAGLFYKNRIQRLPSVEKQPEQPAEE